MPLLVSFAWPTRYEGLGFVQPRRASARVRYLCTLHLDWDSTRFALSDIQYPAASSHWPQARWRERTGQRTRGRPAGTGLGGAAGVAPDSTRCLPLNALGIEYPLEALNYSSR